MAQIINLKTNSDARGDLTVIESNKEIPFNIKRVFYIQNVPADEVRGGHRHKETKMALIALTGSCLISNNNGKEKSDYTLSSPSEALILEPEDFHYLKKFSKDCNLLVLASQGYDPDDYIYEDYR